MEELGYLITYSTFVQDTLEDLGSDAAYLDMVLMSARAKTRLRWDDGGRLSGCPF